MSVNSTHFRIGKSIEEVMLQRSMETDTLPPVHTSQQLQKTISRANKSRKQTSRSGASSRGTTSNMVDSLRQSASASKLLPATPTNPSYENFVMESLMEHCRALQSRVQVCQLGITYPISTQSLHILYIYC